MKALIITGDKVQDHEFIYPYYRLKEAGFEVVVALKHGEETLGIIGTKIPCDERCEIITYEEMETYYPEVDLLIIPGGAKCMEKLRQEQVVLDFISRWNEEGRIIGSICHGAQMLISSCDLKERFIAGYYSIKDDIINAGASYQKTVTQDTNIISASHYKYMGEWMKLILEAVNEQNNST